MYEPQSCQNYLATQDCSKSTDSAYEQLLHYAMLEVGAHGHSHKATSLYWLQHWEHTFFRRMEYCTEDIPSYKQTIACGWGAVMKMRMCAI